MTVKDRFRFLIFQNLESWQATENVYLMYFNQTAHPVTSFTGTAKIVLSDTMPVQVSIQ